MTIYHNILNIVGEEKFNYLFGNLLTPFIITPHVFEPINFSIRKKTEDDQYEAITGNPLYFLYDEIKDYSLESLENNDIVYIGGVSWYPKKHFSGIFPGFNLICLLVAKCLDHSVNLPHLNWHWLQLNTFNDFVNIFVSLSTVGLLFISSNVFIVYNKYIYLIFFIDFDDVRLNIQC